MKADFSRLSWSPEKRFSGVRMQQGRVLLDADWNEQAAIIARGARELTEDAIGASGLPRVRFDANGQPVPHELGLSHEWYGLAFGVPFLAYAGGLRCFYAGESGDEGTRSFGYQPFLPAPEDMVDGRAAIEPGRQYLLYLDAWEQLVTPVEDEALREPALGGPDTTVRTRTAWRLRLLPLDPASPLAEGHDPAARPEWQAVLQSRPTGRLAVRANPDVEITDPCRLSAAGGYRRLENQLYRVEVHTAGDQDTARFKWSRENGAVVAVVVEGSGDRIELEAAPPDTTLGFAPGDWVEILSSHDELLGRPGPIVQLSGVEGTTLTFVPGSVDPPGAEISFAFAENAVPMVRRWEPASPTRPTFSRADGGFWIALEDGIEVRIGDGTFHVGDYWTIPARTATGDVLWPMEDGYPAHRPRQGTEHHYALLSSIVVPPRPNPEAPFPTPIFETIAARFSPLTMLRADDVRVLPAEGVPYQDVQEAIEDLSHRRDLKFHNARLHGWGIVDGLQVHCLPIEAPLPGVGEIDRPKHVILKGGYAIAPGGRDIVVTDDPAQTRVVPVVQMAIDADLLPDPDPDPATAKSFALHLTETGEVAVAEYEAEAVALKSVLEGTLLKDLYDESIGGLIDWVRAQLDPNAPGNDPDALLGPARPRLTVLLNLFWQFIDRDAGGLFLSGQWPRDMSATADLSDDGLLHKLWSELRAHLSSETFCGMYEGVTYPDYDVSSTTNVPEPYTLFGSSSHRHLRVHPTLPLAYSIGYDDEVHVYRTANVGTNKAGLIAKLKFPMASTKVHDVAFSPDGETVYVVATLGTADSVFGRCALDVTTSGGVETVSHTWGPSAILCDLQVVRIETIVATGVVCAVARTKAIDDAPPEMGGLYLITPSTIVADPSPILIDAPCWATGKLVVTSQIVSGTPRAYAYVTAHSTPAEAAKAHAFDEIRRYRLFDDVAPVGEESGAFDGSTSTDEGDDLEDLIVYERPSSGTLIIATTASDNRRLCVLPLNPDADEVFYDLGTTSPTHLAFEPDDRIVYIGMEDDYEVRCFHVQRYLDNEDGDGEGEGDDDDGPSPLTSVRHPVQIGPVSLAVRVPDYTLFVLNHVSATITVIPFGEDIGSRIDPAKMQAYRTAAIQAFIDLLGRLVSFLKDKICEQLLVRYREPEDAKLYLGAVSVKNGNVYQICNFHRRKYVHSFPTVEYWLSAVPILPLLRWVVGYVCCLEIPNLLDFVQIPSKPTSGHVDSLLGLSVARIRNGEEMVRGLDIRATIEDFLGQLSAFGELGLDALGGFLDTPAAPPPVPAALTTSFVGLPASEAAKRAQGKGVSVGSVVKTKAMGPMSVIEAMLSSRSVKSGSTVDLYTDPAGNVRYAQANASPAISATRNVVSTLQPTGSFDEVRDEIAKLRDTLAAQAHELESLREELRRIAR